MIPERKFHYVFDLSPEEGLSAIDHHIETDNKTLVFVQDLAKTSLLPNDMTSQQVDKLLSILAKPYNVDPSVLDDTKAFLERFSSNKLW